MGKDKRIVEVLCRKTDYTDNRPKGHPIQPEISEVIATVKEKIDEYNCSFIYLATDEEKIYLKKSFQELYLQIKENIMMNFIILNQKLEKMLLRIPWVHFNRENDLYYKSLEYISSINLLSKYNLLIAGNCGGNRAALYLNNKYEFYHLFNKGLYK